MSTTKTREEILDGVVAEAIDLDEVVTIEAIMNHKEPVSYDSAIKAMKIYADQKLEAYKQSQSTQVQTHANPIKELTVDDFCAIVVDRA